VTPRRNFLKSAGMMFVSFGAASVNPLVTAAMAQTRATPEAAGSYPDVDFRQLDFVDRRPRKQHGNLLRRQDGPRSGHRHILSATHGRWNSTSLSTRTHLHHGQHG